MIALRILSTVALVAGLTACKGDLEPGGGGATDGSSSSGSGGSSGGAGECAVDERCLEVPDGWSGPVALATVSGGAAPTACASAYGQEVWTLSADLDPGNASCTCTCPSAPQNLGCGPATVELHGSATDCNGTPDETVEVVGNCNLLGGTHDPQRVGVAFPAAEGDCAVMAEESFDTPVFGSTTRACGLGTADACGSTGICAPDGPTGFEGGLCVYQSGDQSCPAGSVFSVQRIMYEGFDDGRTCDGAGCACGIDEICTGDVNLYGELTCGGSQDQIAVGGCADVGITFQAAELLGAMVPGTPACEPTEGQVAAVGSVVGQGSVTFCCEA